MLSTLEASEAVFPGMLEKVCAGKSIVDCATLTPERMAAMSSAVKAAGGSFLEAPVSGSKGPAEAGQLIFLTAGDAAVKEAAEADLEAMGKATFYFGEEVGRGSVRRKPAQSMSREGLTMVVEAIRSWNLRFRCSRFEMTKGI